MTIVRILGVVLLALNVWHGMCQEEDLLIPPLVLSESDIQQAEGKGFTPPPPPTSGGTELVEEGVSAFNETNIYRQSQGLAELAWSQELYLLCLEHSFNQAATGTLSHDGNERYDREWLGTS